MSGYAMLHRALLDHPAFRNESEALAFGGMIMKAAWRATTVRYKGHRIDLKRGQLAISQRDMARALDRDKAWVERLIHRLKSEAMIETRREAGVSVITICNYDKYQQIPPKREAPPEALDEAANEAGVRQRRGTEQEEEEVKNSSEANASGGAPPADPLKQVFDLGVELLTATGATEKQARSLLGKWRKSHGEAKVLQGLLDCRTKAISNPIEWLERRFAGAKYVSASGYEYRGDEQAVMREAERRADWGTYWKAKANLDEPRRASA